MTHKKSLFLLCFVFFCMQAGAQDTTALLQEFNKVLSFSVQPYLHYTTHTKMDASPIMRPQDTMSLHGEFYKNENNVYYSSQQEEMYMEDSFFIQVNHERKSIWIGKIDMDTKDKMNMMPLNDKTVQELFRKKYLISKVAIDDATNRLNFESTQNFDSASAMVVQIGLQYSGRMFMPELMEMRVKMKQALTSEMVEELKTTTSNFEQLLQTINDQQYLVRSQQVSLNFKNIDNSKEKAMQIPSWKAKLNYDSVGHVFTTKEMYSDYEITTTF